MSREAFLPPLFSIPVPVSQTPVSTGRHSPAMGAGVRLVSERTRDDKRIIHYGIKNLSLKEIYLELKRELILACNALGKRRSVSVLKGDVGAEAFHCKSPATGLPRGAGRG